MPIAVDGQLRRDSMPIAVDGQLRRDSMPIAADGQHAQRGGDILMVSSGAKTN